MFKNKLLRSFLVPILLFFLGFLFRLTVLHLFPQSFIYDQVVYKNIALDMVKQFFHVDRYRSYGFPFLLSLFMRFISSDNLYWMVFQSVLDTGSGILVFLMGKLLFRSSKIAFVSSFLYMINVFTSAYVGVLLTESVNTFFVALLFIFILAALAHPFKKKYSVGVLLSLGFLPQIKLSFLFICLVFFCVYAIWLIRNKILNKNPILNFIVISFLFIIPFVPTVLGNFIYWQEVNLTPVDNSFVINFYASLFMENGVSKMPPQVRQIHQEYHTGMTALQRKEIVKKYVNLSLAEIKSDPLKFIVWRVKKMWYIWDKPYVFTYNPRYLNETVNNFITRLNLILLLLGLTGIMTSLTSPKKGRSNKILFHYSSVLFVLYITVSHAFSLADGRYTIPLYPLVFLYAGYGVYYIYRHMRIFFHI